MITSRGTFKSSSAKWIFPCYTWCLEDSFLVVWSLLKAGFFSPPPFSLWTDFNLLWFSTHEWLGWTSRSVISCKESGVTAVAWQLPAKPPPSAPGLASLCLSSLGIPGWSFAWRNLHPGTRPSQHLPCVTDPGFDDILRTGLQRWISPDEDTEEFSEPV